MNSTFHSVWILMLTILIHAANSFDFEPEIEIHRGKEAVQFASNTSGSMGVDSRGTVHWVYYIPDDSNKPPANQIWYQSIQNRIVSLPIRVDSGESGGGRHPTLAIDAQDTVHVVWQDYRHTTAAGNYIDNLEIYYDRMPVDGAFLENDVRLTTTHAPHKGDSGYVPNIAAGNDGRLHVVWYDFTVNGNNADVYLRSSDENGKFPPVDGIESFRITTSEEDFKNYTANWMPDVACQPGGSLYVIWGFLKGWQGPFQIQGFSVSPGRILGDIEEIASKSGRFLDPPRLVSDSSGHLGLVSNVSVNGLYQVQFLYKKYGEAWRGPIIVNDGLLSASQPSLAFDSKGNAYVVWQEDLSGIYQVAIAQVDLTAWEIKDRTILNPIDIDARTPAIALDPRTDRIHVAWIEKGWEGDYAIHTRREKTTGVSDWRIHEEAGHE